MSDRFQPNDVWIHKPSFFKEYWNLKAGGIQTPSESSKADLRFPDWWLSILSTRPHRRLLDDSQDQALTVLPSSLSQSPQGKLDILYGSRATRDKSQSVQCLSRNGRGKGATGVWLLLQTSFRKYQWIFQGNCSDTWCWEQGWVVHLWETQSPISHGVTSWKAS